MKNGFCDDNSLKYSELFLKIGVKMKGIDIKKTAIKLIAVFLYSIFYSVF